MLGIKEGEIHFFRSRSFCLTLPKIFVGETFCAVFQKISGFAEIYGEEGVGYQVFPSKNFCLTVPKKYIGEHIGVSYFCVSTSFMLQRVQSQFFVQNFLSLLVPKSFVGEPVIVTQNFRYRKILAIRRGGGIKIFRRRDFVSQCRKIS